LTFLGFGPFGSFVQYLFIMFLKGLLEDAGGGFTAWKAELVSIFNATEGFFNWFNADVD